MILACRTSAALRVMRPCCSMSTAIFLLENSLRSLSERSSSCRTDPILSSRNARSLWAAEAFRSTIARSVLRHMLERLSDGRRAPWVVVYESQGNDAASPVLIDGCAFGQFLLGSRECHHSVNAPQIKAINDPIVNRIAVENTN